MNTSKKTVLLIAIFILVAQYCLAQPGGGGDPGGGQPVPITGIEILLTLGAALGIKRLMGGKKSKN